ncbi:MAG: serine hydrolase family protein [Parcubacteria group bacterium]|nr:serine hydrolase family protein [Parcubacteria group bacterium]
MAKRVFIIHGWAGYPEECWFLWLKKELEKRGIKAEVPLMPDAEAPKIDKWVPSLEKLVGTSDQNTYFVGHSIGVQTILRYLENIDTQIGGVLAVAGFYTLTDDAFEDEEDKQIAKPWLETPIDSERVKKNVAKITAIFSNNDPFVPLENVEYFKERLGAKTITVEGKGHIGGSDNIKEYPLILDEVLELMR